MTVIGRDRFSEDMIPGRRYRPSACERCGATTLDEAGDKCRPTSDPSGEYSCPGSDNCLNPFGVKWTLDGQACHLTNKSAKAEAKLLDDWVSEMIMADHMAADIAKLPLIIHKANSCRQCGCTETTACRHPEHGNCWWVADGLCSHCANGWGNVVS